MDAFTRRIHEYQLARQYADLRIFARLHWMSLAETEDPALLWAATAQVEHVFGEALLGPVVAHMLSQVPVVTDHARILEIASSFYNGTADLAPAVLARWQKLHDDESPPEIYIHHEIPSLVLLTATTDPMPAFRAMLVFVRHILESQHPSSGFWWLLSDSPEDALLAAELAEARERQHLNTVAKLSAELESGFAFEGGKLP